MNKTRNLLRVVYLIGIILMFVYIKWIIPKYPEISNYYKLDYVKEFVDKSIKKEFHYHTAYGALSDSEYTELRTATLEFAYSLDDCKNNKECYIEKYQSFMNDWVSDKTRVTTRYEHIAKLGFVGQQINRALVDFY